MIRKQTDRLTWEILLLILIFSFQFTPIHAQNEIPDSLITERLQFIKNTLEHDQANTQRWWYSWLATYSAATIGQGAVYLSSGLITWLGFHRTVWAGIGNFALNTVITEAQIWTQPTLAKRNYKKYRQKYLEKEEDISFNPDVNWHLEAYPGGIGIRVVF